MLLEKGAGPATLPGFAQNSFNEFTFIITLTPKSLADQDLFFQRPLVQNTNRIGVHFPYMNQMHWMFGNPYVDVTVPFNPAWLNSKAEWRFTASVAQGQLAIYRNREIIGTWSNRASADAGFPNLKVEPNTPYEADMFIGNEIGAQFHGEIGNWEIHDTVQKPGFGLKTALIAGAVLTGVVLLVKRKGK